MSYTVRSPYIDIFLHTTRFKGVIFPPGKNTAWGHYSERKLFYMYQDFEKFFKGFKALLEFLNSESKKLKYKFPGKDLS
jgi:hypothetical protein